MYHIIKGTKGSYVFNKKRHNFTSDNLNEKPKSHLSFLEKLGIIKKLDKDEQNSNRGDSSSNEKG